MGKADLRYMTAGEMADRTHVLLVPSTRPDDPVEGWMYADAADHHLYYFNGSEWISIGTTGASIVFPNDDQHVDGAGYWDTRGSWTLMRSNG